MGYTVQPVLSGQVFKIVDSNLPVPGVGPVIPGLPGFDRDLVESRRSRLRQDQRDLDYRNSRPILRSTAAELPPPMPGGCPRNPECPRCKPMARRLAFATLGDAPEPSTSKCPPIRRAFSFEPVDRLAAIPMPALEPGHACGTLCAGGADPWKESPMSKKGITGHDEWVVTEALATGAGGARAVAGKTPAACAHGRSEESSLPLAASPVASRCTWPKPSAGCFRKWIPRRFIENTALGTGRAEVGQREPRYGKAAQFGRTNSA